MKKQEIASATSSLVIPKIQPTQANFLSELEIKGAVPNGAYTATLKTFAIATTGSDAVELTFLLQSPTCPPTDFVIRKNALGVQLNADQIQEILGNHDKVDAFSLLVFCKTSASALPCVISNNAKGYKEITFTAEEQSTTTSTEVQF